MKEQWTISKGRLSALEEGLAQSEPEIVAKPTKSRKPLKQLLQCLKLIMYVELILFFGWGFYNLWQTYREQSAEVRDTDLINEKSLQMPHRDGISTENTITGVTRESDQLALEKKLLLRLETLFREKFNDIVAKQTTQSSLPENSEENRDTIVLRNVAPVTISSEVQDDSSDTDEARDSDEKDETAVIPEKHSESLHKLSQDDDSSDIQKEDVHDSTNNRNFESLLTSESDTSEDDKDTKTQFVINPEDLGSSETEKESESAHTNNMHWYPRYGDINWNNKEFETKISGEHSSETADQEIVDQKAIDEAFGHVSSEHEKDTSESKSGENFDAALHPAIASLFGTIDNESSEKSEKVSQETTESSEILNLRTDCLKKSQAFDWPDFNTESTEILSRDLDEKCRVVLKSHYAEIVCDPTPESSVIGDYSYDDNADFNTSEFEDDVVVHNQESKDQANEDRIRQNILTFFLNLERIALESSSVKSEFDVQTPETMTIDDTYGDTQDRRETQEDGNTSFDSKSAENLEYAFYPFFHSIGQQVYKQRDGTEEDVSESMNDGYDAWLNSPEEQTTENSNEKNQLGKNKCSITIQYGIAQVQCYGDADSKILEDDSQEYNIWNIRVPMQKSTDSSSSEDIPEKHVSVNTPSEVIETEDDFKSDLADFYPTAANQDDSSFETTELYQNWFKNIWNKESTENEELMSILDDRQKREIESVPEMEVAPVNTPNMNNVYVPFWCISPNCDQSKHKPSDVKAFFPVRHFT